MKLTYIAFLLAILLIACLSNTEPLTNTVDNMKQEHKQILKNIVHMQSVEQSLYNNLKTSPKKSYNIVQNINKIADYRNKLFNKRTSKFLSFLQKKI